MNLGVIRPSPPPLRGAFFLKYIYIFSIIIYYIIIVLREQYCLNCHRVIKRDRGHVCWRIYISGKRDNLTKLINIVQPHMDPSMYYKLGYSSSLAVGRAERP